MKSAKAFTLAELLIVLMILGVITTFTIPKVLTVQQNQKYNAVTKEAAAAVVEAYMKYKLSNSISAATNLQEHVIPFVNYIKIEPGEWIDQHPGIAFPFVSCSNAGVICYQLASGAIIYTHEDISKLNGTGTNNAMEFMVDPSGRYEGTENSRSLSFWLYANGRLTTVEHINANTCNGSGCWSAVADGEPDWFRW